MKAFIKKDQLKNENAVGKWLQTICYHEFLMKIRQKESRNQLLAEDMEALEAEGALLVQVIPGPEDEIIAEDEIRELQNGCFLAMVRKLTLNQRITFSLVDMFGMRLEEVAGLLEVSVPAAKGLLYRARMNIDSFFSGHCSVLNNANPCSCRAWITFQSNREAMQQKTKELLQKLDYREKGYRFNEAVRKRIQLLYRNMPDRQPEKAWYDRVISALK